jgi:hypothetical protein
MIASDIEQPQRDLEYSFSLTEDIARIDIDHLSEQNPLMLSKVKDRMSCLFLHLLPRHRSCHKKTHNRDHRLFILKTPA